jgi:hypothetical protein
MKRLRENSSDRSLRYITLAVSLNDSPAFVHALAHIVARHLEENNACAPSSCNVRENGSKLS